MSLFQVEEPATPSRDPGAKAAEEERKKRLALARQHLPRFEPLVHRIAIRNQVVGCFPPVEVARVRWVTKLNQWLSVVCELPRIRSSRYDEGIQMVLSSTEVARASYRSLVRLVSTVLPAKAKGLT